MEREPEEAMTSNHLVQPPAHLEGWIQAIQAREIPVLADSVRHLEELHAVEDDVDAHTIVESLGDDPLMVLKLLRHVAQLQRPTGREHSDAETAIEALVMLGITPFFRAFAAQISVEERLTGNDAAMSGVRRVLSRARRAARFALAFAIHRQDHDAPVIHEAALLHDFAEMLLWIHAPALAIQLDELQATETAQHYPLLQQRLLNVTLAELQQALMKTWRLPELLVQITNDETSEHARVRNVQLAIRLSRHSAQGWDDPALPEIVDETAALLSLGTTPTWTLIHDIDS